MTLPTLLCAVSNLFDKRGLLKALNCLKNSIQLSNRLSFRVFIELGDPNQAIFFGSMGVVSALVFANLGAAYGTAKSGVGIVSVAVLKPDLLFRSIIPVVMAGVLGMYGMIIAILVKGQCKC